MHDDGVMPDDAAAHPADATLATDPLTLAALECERYVAGSGWDQPVRLFALVTTAELLSREPTMAQAASSAELAPGSLSAVEQDDLPAHDTLEELLAGIAWPSSVWGAAVAVERVVLPPGAERDLSQDPREALRQVADHPDRADIRLLVAVTRDGSTRALLRHRAHDRDDRIAIGDEIAPGLAAALHATLELP